MDRTDTVRVPRPALESWTRSILTAAGLQPDDAALAAHTLVMTDARGFGTHGLARLDSYLEKLAQGEIRACRNLVVSVEGSHCRIGAGGILGQVAGPYAVDSAVRLARELPVVTCQLSDAAHLGALGILALRAAEAGMVALIFQATPPIMAISGARRPIIGNNPLAMAAPRPNGPPVVVDMACCVAARGNILLAARTGQSLPEGWALDTQGEPTTDPEEALLGSLLPFGGHKGLGLAMIVEVLAGSLAGAVFQKSLNPEGGVRSGTGHMNALIIVLNPDLVIGRSVYDEHIAAWTDHYIAEGGPEARLPGQRAHDWQADSERNGVPLLRNLLNELEAAGNAAGITFPRPETQPAFNSKPYNSGEPDDASYRTPRQ